MDLDYFMGVVSLNRSTFFLAVEAKPKQMQTINQVAQTVNIKRKQPKEFNICSFGVLFSYTMPTSRVFKARLAVGDSGGIPLTRFFRLFLAVQQEMGIFFKITNLITHFTKV